MCIYHMYILLHTLYTCILYRFSSSVIILCIWYSYCTCLRQREPGLLHHILYYAMSLHYIKMNMHHE